MIKLSKNNKCKQLNKKILGRDENIGIKTFMFMYYSRAAHSELSPQPYPRCTRKKKNKKSSFVSNTTTHYPNQTFHTMYIDFSDIY